MKLNRFCLLTFFFSLIFTFESGFLVVGHRGNPSKYPEETIQSDNSAFEDGADYVELDLHVSKDNVLVVSHDRDLSRIVGSNVIVSQNNFSYLHTLKQANGEPIISLDQLFDYYKDKPNTKFFLETKKTKHNNPQNMESLLATSVKKYHMENRVMIHSFSDDSLKTLSHLLPSVPRILIVGSLKRINFEILNFISGVNISSDLVMQDPNLVSNLHSLHKNVFVWAEMNESPELWNWLINNNIDGVVTNFPAMGYRYKLAKTGTKKYLINKDGYYLGRYSDKLIENPYLIVNLNKKLKFLTPVHVSYAVENKEKLYYQVGNHEFASSDFISFDLKPEWILPYWNLKIINKPGSIAPTYNYPNDTLTPNGHLSLNKKYDILGMNGSPKDKWIYTKKGWIKNEDILYSGLTNTSSYAFKLYNNLPSFYKESNIALFSNIPVKNFSYNTLWSVYNSTNQITDIKKESV